jgi:hypothetical protein
MWLGLLIGAILVIVSLVLINKDDNYDIRTILGIILLFVGIFTAVLGCLYAENKPQNLDNLYYVKIDDSPTIFFEEYSYERDSNIAIPKHCYVELSWINKWKYCDSPITVIVPKSRTVLVQGGPSKVYIVGECEK